MRPRTQQERYLVGLAGKLPPITEKQRRYAYDHLFEPVAVYKPRKGEVKCLNCGLVTYWDADAVKTMAGNDEYSCWGCGKTMRMKQASKEAAIQAAFEERFYTVLTTFRGLQVARTYSVGRDNTIGWYSPTEYQAYEIFQVWLDDEGNETITGRRHHRGISYLTWDFHLPWEIKQHNPSCTGMYQFDDLFDLTGVALYPLARVTPRLRRNGWDKRMMRYSGCYSIADGMRWLLSVPDAEMLWKTGQHDLFMWMVRGADRTLPYRHQVCTANRHGYIIPDAQMWMDYLGMAAELGMDIRNPKVVCPDVLTEAHDEVLHRVTRLRKRREAEEERRKAVTYEEEYRKAKGAYFGICFGNEDVRITVLTSVAEIAEEGTAMHHCVYQAKYFMKPDSLILSARDSEGNRLETVELSLKTFKVLQSRAKCNQKSPLHDEIIRLVEANAELFRNVEQLRMRKAG